MRGDDRLAVTVFIRPRGQTLQNAGTLCLHVDEFDLVREVHELLNAALREKDCTVDGIFFCPHHPRGIIPEYQQDCDCRKPKTGLIKQARNFYDIDMSNSYVVGDRYSDIELANRLNLKGILVKTGYGRGEIEYILPGKKQPAYIAEDLLRAVEWIVKGGL